MKNKRQKIGSILLLLTAAIWGVAFVAQSVGMNYVGPFTFNSIRFFIGGLFLVPFIFVTKAKEKRKLLKEMEAEGLSEKSKAERQAEWEIVGRVQRKYNFTGGICCGLALCAASLLQQIGIMHTTVGKTGFITTLYVIMVPILGIFLKKKIPAAVWLSAVLSLLGLYLLCMKETLSFQKGDLYVLACAFVFALHIMIIDHFSPKGDGVVISCIQFFVSAIVSGMGMLLLEHPSLSGILAAYVPILYAGILSCGVAYTLQIIGQKDTEPAVASLILSMEAVISVLAGWIILGQVLSGRELLGCVIVFAAVIMAQLAEQGIIKIGIPQKKNR